MAVRKLKPIEERDPYAAAVLDAFDALEQENTTTMRPWYCMTEAPRDGTEVELLLRHRNYRYCKTDDERRMWEEVVRAKWIDHNGGGWCWRGMAGTPCGWRPLTPNDGA